MKHDQLRHLRSLRLLLSQDKSPLGFFLAAGCPRSVKDGGNPLLPDMKGLAKIISDAHDADSADSPYKRLMEEMGKAGKDTKNVEDVLTFIRSMKEVSAGGNVRGFSEAELTALEKDICEKIADSVKKDLPIGDNSYKRFANWICAIDRGKPVKVISIYFL